VTRTTASRGPKWTSTNLRWELEHGSTIEDAAHLHCRAGTIDEVRAKARELGLLKE
jgi:hypothetical protein